MPSLNPLSSQSSRRLPSPAHRLALATLLGIALAGSASPALAERADRSKPIILEADRISVDDIKKVQVYDGAVVLTQGTLQIRADRITVTQDADGFQRGSATGGPKGLARFRQKREGQDTWVEGEGERIDHDARSEKTEFFTRAWVRSGQDEVRGDHIVYDSLSEKYLVTASPASASKSPRAPGVPAGRVRAILQPKAHGDQAVPSPAGEALPLKPAPTLKRSEE